MALSNLIHDLSNFAPSCKILIREKCTSKNFQNSFICEQKKNKNSESKVICDTHLKQNIFNKNRLKHEKNGKQICCPS